MSLQIAQLHLALLEQGVIRRGVGPGIDRRRLQAQATRQYPYLVRPTCHTVVVRLEHFGGGAKLWCEVVQRRLW